MSATIISPASHRSAAEISIPDQSVSTYARLRTLSWGAIFAGLTAAMALQVLLMMLGAGLGFAIYHPITEENPVADLGKGAVVIQGLSAVVALWFGGWVAGRFTPVGARATGLLHGFSVWCAATVTGVLVVALGAGWVLGDLSKLVGGGLSMAGKPAATAVGGVADLAKDAVKKSGETLASFTDEAIGTRTTAARTPAAGIRAKRELSFALARYFSLVPVKEADADIAAKRTAVKKALVDASGLSESEADKMITDWTASYDSLRAELAAAKNAAAAKARVAADEAAGTLAVLSLCAFVAFLIGAISAAAGGRHGARCALKAEGNL